MGNKNEEWHQYEAGEEKKHIMFIRDLIVLRSENRQKKWGQITRENS